MICFGSLLAMGCKESSGGVSSFWGDSREWLFVGVLKMNPCLRRGRGFDYPTMIYPLYDFCITCYYVPIIAGSSTLTILLILAAVESLVTFESATALAMVASEVTADCVVLPAA